MLLRYHLSSSVDVSSWARSARCMSAMGASPTENVLGDSAAGADGVAAKPRQSAVTTKAIFRADASANWDVMVLGFSVFLLNPGRADRNRAAAFGDALPPRTPRRCVAWLARQMA